jgi:ribosomal protein L27
MTAGGSCSATGVVIFRGVRFLESYTQDLPTGSSVSISETENEENLPYGFSGVKCFDEKSVLKGEWIGCQRCKKWSHEICVSVQGKKKSIWANCMSGDTD